MKNSIKTGNSVPTAHVTVNKNRVKIYENNNYYLTNGQTFEVELYNPTYTKIKAVIELDGHNVTAGGVILKPGQRIYLERFIDSNNKFLYETYEVDDSWETKKAISNNGKVEIKFYMEEVVMNLGSYQPRIFHYANQNPNSFYSTNIGTTSGNTGDYTLTTTNVSNHMPLSFMDVDMDTTLNTSMLRNSGMSETGRVEKGEASDQEFIVSNDKFSSYAFETVKYTISPVSKQPITKENITEARRYCHDCGSKTKANHNFCSSCGIKL